VGWARSGRSFSNNFQGVYALENNRTNNDSSDHLRRLFGPLTLSVTMPAEHKIDTNIRCIITTWSGEAADRALIEALAVYQRTIKSRPEYATFDEIVDFSNASNYDLSVSGIQRLVELGSTTDAPGTRTKMAIVVTTPVAYGLARMYQAYRGFMPHGSKVLRVFRTNEDARNWVENK
jgi:hypothetical protein